MFSNGKKTPPPFPTPAPGGAVQARSPRVNVPLGVAHASGHNVAVASASLVQAHRGFLHCREFTPANMDPLVSNLSLSGVVIEHLYLKVRPKHISKRPAAQEVIVHVMRLAPGTMPGGDGPAPNVARRLRGIASIPVV